MRLVYNNILVTARGLCSTTIRPEEKIALMYRPEILR